MDCIHGYRFGALDNTVEGGVRGRAANRTEQQTLAAARYFARRKMDCRFLCGPTTEYAEISGEHCDHRIDGGQPRKLLPIPLSVSLAAGIRWSPDGRQLTYVNRGKDGDDIWSFRLSDGSLHQITSFHGVALISFDWSPDGKQLAVETIDGE
jgi:hypothetical protein